MPPDTVQVSTARTAAQTAFAEVAAAPVRNGVRMVIGASRGIGLALVRAQLADPDVRRVIATLRPSSNREHLDHLSRAHGERLLLRTLDVTREESLQTFSRFIARQNGGVDLAIHAAGMLHGNDLAPEKSLAQCNTANLMQLFQVNSIGPLMVARALLPALHRKRPFTFAVLSAMVGSIGDNRLGGWYGYRASKAAVNQFVKTLAIECRVKHPRGAIVAMHPGTTDTDLSRPFQKNVRPHKLYTPEQTAARILGVLQNVDCHQTGRFLNWDGGTIPW